MKSITISMALASIFTMVACSSQKDNQSSNKVQKTKAQQNSRQQGPPSYSKLLSEMDANKDGKLAITEVKGPMVGEFSKIDLDGDGFISKAEFENAPKPQGRPQRPRQ